jgi:hypothetical protein
MNFKRLILLTRIFLFLVLFTPYMLHAQWGKDFSNSWVSYDSQYVKIKVGKTGIHKILLDSIPSDFKVGRSDFLQLWHKGKQVSVISATEKEILFYGVKNNGESDSLVYRPMSDRMNPYFSIYSDESSYFLTNGKEKGLRAETVPKGNAAGETLDYHLQTGVTTFKQDYSLSTLTQRPDFMNSYYEGGASPTSSAIVGGLLSKYSLQLINEKSNTSETYYCKLLIHGRSNNSRNLEIYVGANENSLRLVTSLPNTGFKGVQYVFKLQKSDFSNDGKSVLGIKSVSSVTNDKFSLAYYQVSYPQQLNMSGSNSFEFNLPNGTTAKRLQFTGAPVNAGIYDITNPENIRVITGTADDITVDKSSSATITKLFVSNEINTISIAKMSLANFSYIDPKSYNYLIITTKNLKTASDRYAAYRSSANGGSFKPVVVSIEDIYNQFNFGEPSPVGIRRFVDYMLSDGKKDKYLLLIGKSITFFERMVKELPDEVPTIGFPGSDILLVEGLAGVSKDVPAIPVGRLSAVSAQNIDDYLQKVKDYEANVSADAGWKKNILHLNGGKTASEISIMKSSLVNLAPLAETGLVGSKVTAFVKQQGISEVEKVDISENVNNGVGMITYVGHGSTTVTDLDMGYITDATRGYNNSGKYPLMYFNGCGVGNVFSARFDPNPGSANRIALSLDWLMAPNRGAVSIIANTFDSYISSSTLYLTQLYRTLYTDINFLNSSIGIIQKEVATKIMSSQPSSYDIGNIHQSLLQGDPAIKLIHSLKPDYSVDFNKSILLLSEGAGKTIGESSTIRGAVIVSNLGLYKKADILSIKVKIHYKKNTEDTRIININSVAYKDTLYFTFSKDENLDFIEVSVDPEKKLDELSIANNNAVLSVNWADANSLSLYPLVNLKDIISPVLDVRLNQKTIKNGEIIQNNAVIDFNLNDDQKLAKDPSLVSIFVKPCLDNSCDFVKLSSSDLVLVYEPGISPKTVVVKYPLQNLAPGSYTILVDSRDLAGNTTLQKYQIQFLIVKNVPGSKLKVIASPNPASEYIHFEWETNQEVQHTSIMIYDIKGVKVVQKDWDSNANIREWYWMPNAASGMYVYKFFIQYKENSRTDEFTGKVVLIR